MAAVFRKSLISFAAALWTLAAVLPVHAGPLEDAQAALTAGDYVTALRLLATLVDEDDTRAETLLGFMYIKGQGVPQDYNTGMRWMRLAADKGSADAQNQVGILYQRGWGAPRNEAEALKWFRLAADQGSISAQNTSRTPLRSDSAWRRIFTKPSSGIASQPIKVRPTRKCHRVAYDTAFTFPRTIPRRFDGTGARRTGSTNGPNDTWIHSPQYNIAAMYASGRGTAQDYVRALMWFHAGCSVRRYQDAEPVRRRTRRHLEIHRDRTTRPAVGADDACANRRSGKNGAGVAAASRRHHRIPSQIGRKIGGK